MKLRNLLFGTMIACAFAACSNEDDPINGGDQPTVAEGEATLSVQIDKVQTKALDTDIKTLSVLVFKGTNSDAVLEKIGTVTTEGDNVTVVEKISVTSGDKQVLVLANVSAAGWEGETLDVVLAKEKTFTGEVNGGLSMNSKVYKVNLRVSEDNYLGYALPLPTGGVSVTGDATVNTPVKLYRNVAKVELASIDDKSPAAGYPGGRLAVTGIFILHGKNATKLATEGQWGSTECSAAIDNAVMYKNGYLTDDTYAAWVGKMKDKAPIFGYLLNNKTNQTYDEEGTYTAESVKDAETKNFYVYENTNTDFQTLLVVKGDYSYTGVAGTITETNRYYTVAVGFNGVPEAGVVPSGDNFAGLRGNAPIKGVLRNLKYVISMKITGPGYETPFGPKPGGGGSVDPENPDPNKPDPENPSPSGDTFLNVTCQVVGFEAVTQNPDAIE